MKRFLIILVFAWPASAAQFPVTLEKETRISKITKDVFVATELRFYHANILIVRLKDNTVVLASSPYDNQSTRRLVRWIKTNIKPKKIIAINTHFHLDGTGGNQVYHEEGVETWATKTTARLQVTEGKDILKMVLKDHSPDIKRRITSTRIEVGQNLFDADKGKVLDYAGEKVEIFFPGEAHSPDNVIVYFPSKKLLFGGCMIKPKSLGWLRNANVNAWEQSAKNLLKFEVDHVIPGHGLYGDRTLIEKTIKVAREAAKQTDILIKNFH